MKVGVYPGSFSPWHKGHLNILEKAEKIFDKVILARGVNPEKKNLIMPLPNSIANRAWMNYDGLLTDFIKNLPYDNITVIRGLRNNVDLQYELNQYRYLQDLMPDIQLISIFCDKEYEHISSSGIRLLTQYGEDKVKKYLVL
jgi:pantetheine-phosphate adenylyltransferase